MSRKLLLSWGTVLGLVPFIALLIYCMVVVGVTARGAVANTVSMWILREIGVALISVIVFVGLAFYIVRRKKSGGDGA